MRGDAVAEWRGWVRDGRKTLRRWESMLPYAGPQRAAISPPIFFAIWLMTKDDSGFGDLRDAQSVKLRVARVLRRFGVLPGRRRFGGEPLGVTRSRVSGPCGGVSAVSFSEPASEGVPTFRSPIPRSERRSERANWRFCSVFRGCSDVPTRSRTYYRADRYLTPDLERVAPVKTVIPTLQRRSALSHNLHPSPRLVGTSERQPGNLQKPSASRRSDPTANDPEVESDG